MCLKKSKLLLLLFFFFSAFGLMPVAYAAVNIWDVVSREFSMNHEENRPEVQEQIQWLIKHPGYLQKVCRQSQPYIYHILKEVKKYQLPGELALLPMLESAYDPFAYSRVGAAGLWQLMPKTATELGLSQDWWFDGRRSVSASTRAALKHLFYLSKLFNGNWTLAIAAYDAGEGSISRAINATGRSSATDFWILSVPRETQVYVPRFFALAAIIKDPARYNVILPYVPYIPYFEEVDVGSPIDLSQAARLAGISYSELIKLNPGFNRWMTSPNEPFTLLIPVEKSYAFNQNLIHLPYTKRVSWVKHIAQKGDTLYNIAMRYHTTVNLVKQLNQLKQDTIKFQQVLLIPSSNTNSLPLHYTKRPLQTTFGAARRVIHIVQAQDTLQSIEKKYAINSADIQRWNPNLDTTILHQGQQLLIWKTKA